MAIGAHELLLIVRAQNQASAAFSRISRDVRRLQALRDAEMHRGAIANRLARNNLQQIQQLGRIESVLAADGRVRLQNQQAIARNQLQQLNVENRLQNLDVRRTSLARAASNLQVQRLRLQKQELTVESSLEKIELRRAAITNQIGRIGTQQIRNQVQQEDLVRKAFSLETQLLQRRLAAQKAESAYMRQVRAGVPVAGTPVDIRRTIAQRRVTETQMSIAGIGNQARVLDSAAADLRKNIIITEGAMKDLDAAELQLAKDTEILRERHRALSLQMDNVAARGRAVAGSEQELRAELVNVERQLSIINAQWQEHKAVVISAAESLRILQSEEAMLNSQLREQEALIRRQNLDRIATGARAVSHTGRVMQMVGLVTTAAFGAMGIAAAKFNTEATRASTQTGAIGQSAQVTVRNAERIQKSITDLMQVIPADQHQMTDALYNIYSSMNTTFGGGVKLLKLFGQVWVSGGMQGTINDVADALITLGNNWKISANDMGAWNKLAASTLATVRFGRLTVQQYTQTMNQLAPAFKGANQSIEQMNGALAFLTRLLPSQRITAAGIARMMETIQRFAAHPVAGFEGLAKSIVDTTGSLKPLNQVIDIMIKRFPQLATNGVFLTNFFKTISNQQGTVQARRAFQAFVHQIGLYQDTLRNTTGDTKEFSRSLKAMEGSTGVKWAQFVNNMRALGLELGSAVIPALTKMAKPLIAITKWFNGLSDSTKNQIGYIAAIAAVLTLVGGTVLAVVGSLAAFIYSMRILKSEQTTLLKLFGLGGGSLKTLGSEAGFTRLQFVGISSALIILIPLLRHFHINILEAITGANGLTGALKVLEIFVAALTFRSMLGGLLKLAPGLAVAAGGMGKFRGTILALRSASFLEIAAIALLGAALSNLVRMIPGWDNTLKRFGGTLYNAFHPSNNKNIQVTADNIALVRQEIEKIPKNMRPTLSLDSSAYQLDIKKIQAAYNTLQGRTGTADIAMPATLIQKRLEALFPELTPGAISVFINLAARRFKRVYQNLSAGLGRTAREGLPAMATIPAAIIPPQTDAMFLKRIQRVHELQKIYETAPNLSAALTAWKVYHSALDALTKTSTVQQKMMIDDLLGGIKDLATMSDEAVMRISRQANAVQKAAQKTADPALFKQYYALQKTLQDNATSDQLSVANSTIESEQAIHDKRVQLAKDAAEKQKQAIQDAQSTLKSATQGLLSFYQSSLQQYQSQLGTLFQGPFMQSAIMQNRQQFGFAARPKDLLRDMQESVGHFERFQRTIARARRRGAPQELLTQIQQLGPEAQKQMDTLLRLSPGQFKRYVDLFKRGQADAQRAAKADLDRQIKQWQRFGRNVSLAIITGIRSETPGLEKALESRIKEMFPLLAGRAGTTPKITVTPREPAPKITPVRTPQGTRTTQTVIHQPVTYNVHPTHHGEGLESMLRRSHFFYRNRKGNL